MSKDNLEAFETFEFDLPPIRGFPELRWAGKRPFKSTQYFPAQKKESYGDPTDGWWNRIYWGDNLQVMSHLLREFRGKVDLIYIDPPFDSNADYKKVIKVKGLRAGSDHSAFEEKQYSDIWNSENFCQFMFERITLARELLSETGSVFFHFGPNISQYMKVILDEVFGPERFINEIIWRRSFSHAGSSKFGIIHDSIFYYSKTAQRTWNEIRVPIDPEYRETFCDSFDEKVGKRYQRIPLTGAGITKDGESGRAWRGVNPTDVGRHWAMTHAELDRLDAEGRIHWPKKEDGVPRLKKYEDEIVDMAAQDIWTDINKLHNQSTEQLGYPTQKPESLIDRIIKASSNPGDIVLDFFMGSGTAQAVSMKLGRRFIGADINLGAIETTIKRLNLIREAARTENDFFAGDTQSGGVKAYTGFEVYNVNDYDLFRNPVEAKELIREAMELQPLLPGSAFDGLRDGYLVKVMPVNRIATRQDLNEVINGLDFKAFERRKAESPNKPVERVHLICMGHEPDLGSHLVLEAKKSGFDIEVMVTDLIRDKAHLHFKKSSDARLSIENGELIIEGFYPMNLLQKLSLESDALEDWRQLVESVKVDFHYDGAVLTPEIVDAPGKDGLVVGRYAVPADAATIRVKITDLLSESWEGDIKNG
jgi:adenine-specific DNA-methyltransferase